MSEDDVLTHLFRSDLDRMVALPPAERWIRSTAASPWSRSYAFARALPVVVLTVVAAMFVGAGVNAVRSQQQSSASPAAAQPSAPTADPRFSWFVDAGGTQALVVSEGSLVPSRQFAGRGPRAVSPDGRAVAYWSTGPVDALPHELHIIDLRSGSDRIVATLNDDLRGGQAGWLVWSTDGTGLAFAVSDRDAALGGPRGPVAPRTSIVRLLSLADGRMRDVIRTSGTWLRPIVWNQGAGIVAAVDNTLTGLATRSYVHDLTSGSTREYAFARPLESGSVRIDDAGVFALGAESGCDGQTCRTLGLWPITSPDTLVRRGVVGASIEEATFRPGTRDVWVVAVARGSGEIQTWGDRGSRPTQIRYRLPGTSSGGASFAFRADGSTLLVIPGGLNHRSAWLVDATTGADTAVPWEALWRPEDSLGP
jgi:hypothetical protein